MGYAIAVRSQADDLGDEYSDNAGTDCSQSKDVARQEFKDESDINLLLGRFGVQGTGRIPTFGEVDYGIDLQAALGAIHDAKRAYTRLPKEVKDKYRNWQELLNAVEDGSFEGDLAPKPVPEPPARKSDTTSGEDGVT